MRRACYQQRAAGWLLAAVIALPISLPAAAQSDPVTPGYLKRPSTHAQSTQERNTREQQTAEQRAKQWNLSVSDWERYKMLLKGIDGYRSDKLDPLTLLGMHARSDAERQHYARQLARMEHERVVQVLNFQKAYDQASADLYPGEKPLDTDSIASAMAEGDQAAQRLGLDGASRKAVFVRAHNCSACRRKVKQLATAHTPMDIFVIGAKSDDAIRAWAKQVGLDPQRVRSGDITLNHAPTAVARSLAGQSLPRVSDR